MTLSEAGAKITKTKQAAAVEEKKSFLPSKYQKAIFDWVIGDGKSLVVEALAGSGKTTTGVQMLKYVPSSQDIVYLAFNRHIAEELKTRVPSNVKVMTYHGLGNSAVRNAYGEVKLEERKVDILLEGILDKFVHKHLFNSIKHLVSLVKGNLTGTSTEELEGLAMHYNIELNGDRELIFLAVTEVIRLSALQTNTIDFDDMCWLPVFHNLPTRKYDFIFIDEAQDTNKNQIALALMSVKKNGRIVAVGDRYQSIYGFRGADVNAIPNLIENLEAETLPLSITYRCPKSHVSLINQMFPNIPLECAESSKDGEVRNITKTEFLKEVKQGDMVLCRCNAPLVPPAYELIKMGIKAIIRGRDIGTNLTTIIRKLRADNIVELSAKLDNYCQKESQKLMAREHFIAAQAVQDKIATLHALMVGTETISELEDKIETIFSDNNAGIVFSSVHKAKGLEAEKVFILEPKLMPHPMAKSDWEVDQEKNIQYVAYTRSLDQLILVS
jgi:DNA helicase-2/ATP-dependent DNA helicase PcrA